MKDLLIAHGEKVVVAVVAAACAWTVYGAFTDPSIRAKVSDTAITAKKLEISRVMSGQKPPALKPGADYLAQMKTRFREELPAPSASSWVFALPDVGPAGENDFVYVYELKAPVISANDSVGTLTLDLTLAPATRPADRRIADQNVVEWGRDGGAIANRAQVIALQVEMRVGDGQWQSVKAKGVGSGLIPLGKEVEPISLVVDEVSAWERHTFRARAIAKATGFTLAAPGAPGDRVPGDASVFVTAGDSGAEPDWAAFTAEARKRDPAFLGRWLKGGKGPLPAGISVSGGEQVYTGPWSPDVAILATADRRFALRKIGSDPADPSKTLAEFLITKQFKNAEGKTAWAERPEVFKTEVGKVVGGTRNKVIWPLSIDPRQIKDREEDFTTPFTLKEVKAEGVKRVWYYELKAKPRMNGKPGREIEVKPKEVDTKMVVLQNRSNGALLELAELDVIRPPSGANMIIYPNFKGPYDEGAEFLRNPVDFHQFALVPRLPKLWEAGKGPLADLAATGDAAVYTTDTDYYELGDGRLVYWWPSEKKLEVYPNHDLGAIGSKVTIPTPAPGLEKPAPKPPAPKPPPVAPTGQQDGMPPGGMPPGETPPPRTTR